MADERSDANSYYALRPKAPVRAWLLAIVLVVGGGVAAMAGSSEPRTVWLIVLGVVLLVAGVALGITSVAFVSSRTLHIVLSSEGFEVTGPSYHKSGAWIDVDSVSTTPDGARLVIAQGRVDRTYIQVPGGTADARMRQITADIAARLNALEG